MLTIKVAIKHNNPSRPSSPKTNPGLGLQRPPLGTLCGRR